MMVLIIVAAAFAVGATLLPVRWVITRYDALGRSRSFPAISTALCLALALACYYPAMQHNRLQRRLTVAARAVGGVPIAVHCETAGAAALDVGQELGFVNFSATGSAEPIANLELGPCHQLSKWLRSDQRTQDHFDATGLSDELIAVHVLTHETMHVTGIRDEAIAECRAMQHDAAMAMALGASQVWADGFARWYLVTVYPAMPDAYRSDECRAGGALDQHRPHAPWAPAA